MAFPPANYSSGGYSNITNPVLTGSTGTSGLNFPSVSPSFNSATPSSSSSSGASTTQYDPFSGRTINSPAPVNRVIGIASPGTVSGGGSAGPSAGTGGPAYGDPGTFAGAVTQQAGDYDKIMQSLQTLASGYQQSPDVTASLNNLNNLASTGGYSAQDISDLRNRAISPIKSIYSTAQQNLDRSQALSGGYSPNAGAAQAQLARDMSQQVGQAEENADAGIAQNVAANKLSIAPSYASAAQGAQGQNVSLPLQIQQMMASLYGTNPALINTFGNQVATATGLNQNQQNINNNQLNSVLSAIRWS